MAKGVAANLGSIELLYKSFCARIHVGDLGGLSIYEETIENDNCESIQQYSVSFMVNSTVTASLCIPVTPADSVYLESVSNVVIDAPSLTVVLGTDTVEARVANSTIVCKKIIWKSRTSTIEVAPGAESLIVATEGMQGQTNFDLIINGTLKVDSPNLANYYRLYSYAFDYSSEESIEDPAGFSHRVRCILLCFRTHGKDTLGKTADYVRNIIVGSSKPKQRVLDFLVVSGIIYEEAHLYKVNMELLGNKGINFSSVVSANIKSCEALFDEFQQFINSKQTKIHTMGITTFLK